MQDEVIGWGEETVPPRQDEVPRQDNASQRDEVPQQDEVPARPEEVPSASKREQASLWQRWRGAFATAVLTIGLIAAAVAPVMLCVRAWHEAESIRGVGAGRGVLKVSSCAYLYSDSDGDKTYTCSGVFTRPGPPPPADEVVVTELSTMTVGSSYPAGATVAGRMIGDGEVFQADDDYAAAMTAAWFTVACAVAFVEGAAVWMLACRIRGVPVIRLRRGPFRILSIAPRRRPFRRLLVAALGVAASWLLAFIPLMILYHTW